jgi:hypothetical protein
MRLKLYGVKYLVAECDIQNSTDILLESSLIRHSKKCTLEPTPSLRQKACKACTFAKARCDLTRPSCSRCIARGVECAYIRPPRSPAPTVHLNPQLRPPSQPGITTPPTHHQLELPAQQQQQQQHHHQHHDGFYTGATPASISFGSLEATATNGFFDDISPHDNNAVDLSLLDPGLGGAQVGGDVLVLTPQSHSISSGTSPAAHGLKPGPPPPTPEELDSWMLAVVTKPLVADPQELIMHSSEW